MTLTSTTVTASPATTHPASTPGTPLKAADLIKHPAFSSNDWSSRIPPVSTGSIPINSSAARPGGPFSIGYEIHGRGPTKIVWIMGLGAYRWAWKRQSKYFGHDADRGERFSCLVFDNRGIGESGKPRCRYTTREMAGDVVELLGGLGWLDKETVNGIMGNFYGKADATGEKKAAAAADNNNDEKVPLPSSPNGVSTKRDLVIAGASMGGMIAQELALLLPADKIQALILISTCPRLVRTVPFVENLRQRINMFVPRDLDVQLEEVAHRLFSREFLQAKDQENEDETLNFPTIRDRFASMELAKRMDKDGFTKVGFVLQAIAAGWHHKSPEQLRELANKVGGPRIFVVHGTEDRMIASKHFDLFREDFGDESGVEFRSWEGCGHVLTWEVEEEFNQAVEDFIEKTAKLRAE